MHKVRSQRADVRYAGVTRELHKLEAKVRELGHVVDGVPVAAGNVRRALRSVLVVMEHSSRGRPVGRFGVLHSDVDARLRGQPFRNVPERQPRIRCASTIARQ